MDGLLSFAAAYGTVLLLGLQSKIMRDDRWFWAFFTSWGITLTQTITTYVIAHRPLPIEEYVLWSGFGGSLGIVSSHFVYNRLTGDNMSKMNKAASELHKGHVRELTNSLHAAIDTGNPEAARLVMKLAEAYLEEGRINLQDRADLQADYDQHFSD